MQYYISLFDEIKGSFGDLLGFVSDASNTSLGLRFLFWVLIGFWVYMLLGTVGVSFRNEDIRFGTVSFWFVLSLLTLGIGNVLLLIIGLIKSNRVVSRQYNGLIFVILPTALTYLLSFASYKKWIDGSIDYSFASLIGVATVFAEMLLIIINRKNKRSYVVLERKGKTDADAFAISNTKEVRNRIRSCHTDEVLINSKGEEIPFHTISEAELEKCLLIDEKIGKNTIRQYMKASGECFYVVVIEALTMPKIYDCLAGLMVLLALTTPYIPFLINRLMLILTRG